MTHHPVRRAARGRVVLLLLLVVLVTAAVAAVPAAAATPTSFSLNAQSTTVNWGATAILNGVLQTAENPPQPVDGQTVTVRYSASAGPPWIVPADGTISSNTPEQYGTGEYTYAFKASRNFYWQMRFAGTVAYDPKNSRILQVKVKPVIGKPSCPSSVRHGNKFTVSGSLKPRYPSGSRNVSLKAQRYTSGEWKAYRTYTATTTNSGSYSKYSLKFSISRTGKYRFYATTANTTTLAAGKSAYSRSMQIR